MERAVSFKNALDTSAFEQRDMDEMIRVYSMEFPERATMLQEYFDKNSFSFPHALGANSDYTKFIIVSQARSGTHFLRSSLNAHPKISVFDEVFEGSIKTLCGCRVRYPYRMECYRELFPEHFLKKIIYRKTYGAYISSIGFLLFYHHAQQWPTRKIWKLLTRETDIRVIHLIRRNMLATLVSGKIARQQGVWSSTSRSVPPGNNQNQRHSGNFLMELSHKECLEFFTDHQKQVLNTKEAFMDHPVLTIYYEDLVENYENNCKRILSFLSVSPIIPLYSKTKQQRLYRLSEAISNFSKLKDSFYGTPFYEFFIDQ